MIFHVIFLEKRHGIMLLQLQTNVPEKETTSHFIKKWHRKSTIDAIFVKKWCEKYVAFLRDVKSGLPASRRFKS